MSNQFLLNLFCLINQIHQLTDQNISFLVHQLISLIRKCQRIFCKNQISFCGKCTWIHNTLGSFPDILIFFSFFFMLPSSRRSVPESSCQFGQALLLEAYEAVPIQDPVSPRSSGFLPYPVRCILPQIPYRIRDIFYQSAKVHLLR